MSKFREITTSSGKKVLGGKDAKSNEEVVKQADAEELLLHTEKPGSPFVNVKGKASIKDIGEAGVFCARYSQDWRDNKKDVKVHIFKKRDVYKRKGMKVGTFGVKHFRVINIKKIKLKNF